MKTLSTILLIMLGLFIVFNGQASPAMPVNVAGNPHGHITLVEYFDYECPHCRHMQPVIDALIQQNPQLRVVYRDTPILSNQSWLVAMNALAAEYQQDYLALHHALMEQAQAPTLQTVMMLAKHEGLDVKRLQQDGVSNKIQHQLFNNIALAESHSIHNMMQLPLIVIGHANGHHAAFVLRGETAYSILQTAINQLNK